MCAVNSEKKLIAVNHNESEVNPTNFCIFSYFDIISQLLVRFLIFSLIKFDWRLNYLENKESGIRLVLFAVLIIFDMIFWHWSQAADLPLILKEI
jgi:hypothetical protein